MRILTLDIGSSSIKAALHTGRRFLPPVRIPFATHFDNTTAEIPISGLLTALKQAIHAALAPSPTPPDALAFCTFSPGFLITTPDNTPLTPIITHADRRSSDTSLALIKRHPKPWWLTRTGNLPFPGGIASSTLAYLQSAQPTLFKKPFHIHQLSSFITTLLTNNFTIDPSQATFLGLYDLRTSTWSKDLLSLLHLPASSLPKLQPADSILGTLNTPFAKSLNLPPIPLLGGFIDTSAAILQTPMTPGQLTHNPGSTDVLAMCLPKPHPADGLLTRPLGVSVHFPNRWLAVHTLASAGSALQWAKAALFPELSPAAFAQRCKKRAAEPISPVTCLPTFVGERTAIEQPPGATFQNIRLDTTKDDLLRALLHGLIHQRLQGYQRLAAIHPPNKTIFTADTPNPIIPALQKAWPHHPTFHTLPTNNLAGLLLLTQKTLT